MRLLVVGVDRVDAGKTTFSTGLVEAVDALGVKPRAGNDYWFDHDDVRDATGRGRLYGKDARRLAAASAADVEPEAINPVHRLWRPTQGHGQGLLGPRHREFVCDRVGPVGVDAPDGSGTVDGVPGAGVEGLVVNGDADVPDAVRDRLPVDGATTVDSLDAFNATMARRHRTALEALADRVRSADRVVIESYSDVARPLGCPVDAVAAVEPGRVRLYDGDRFATACQVASSSPRDGQLEQRVEDVLDPLDPLSRHGLPPLPKAERADPAAVADAYGHAYDDLVAIAIDG